MRSFTDAERARIREGLRENGRELFARYGLKKTTIADLTDPLDIASSTFYQFYDSKEALYLEILEREGEETTRAILADSFEATDDPEEAVRRFLFRVIEEIETNPLVRRVLVEDEFDRLREAFTDEEYADAIEEDIAFIVPYVEPWVEAGRVRGEDPEVVAGAIRAVTFVTLHREDIGEEAYPATRDLLVEAFSAGLTEGK